MLNCHNLIENGGMSNLTIKAIALTEHSRTCIEHSVAAAAARAPSWIKIISTCKRILTTQFLKLKIELLVADYDQKAKCKLSSSI